MPPRIPNPFRFGDLALDEAFTNREQELGELEADILNGQNVVLFAPRRYGKSSLVWRVVQQVTRQGVLVAQVDLMRTPTKQKLAEKLAASIHDHVAGPLFRARERLGVFRGLRVAPVVQVDPETGDMSFSFEATRRAEDIDDTLERLLELPATLAAERGRRAALVFDEFQEVTEVDPHLPSLLRAVFQTQGDVAHVYLGSKRHMMQRLFNDRNEPFWRSARQMELGPIAPEAFRRFVDESFQRTRRAVEPEVLDELLGMTRGHPYGTQEACYFLWETVAPGGTARGANLREALARLLRSEHAHFSRVWEDASRAQRLVLQALALGPGRPMTTAYRDRHGLPPVPTVQKALATLTREELVGRDPDGAFRIVEPFFDLWIRRYES